MKYELVIGEDIKKDTELITDKMEEDNDTVFVYTGSKPLYSYIEELDACGKLEDEIQFKLKICYEKTKLDLTYKSEAADSHRIVKVTSMHQLIGLLDKKEQCCIVVNNDERNTLAEVIQQLIYIGFPLTKAEVMLKKEEKDRDRAGRFMAQVDVLNDKLRKTVENLSKVIVDAENRPDIRKTLDDVNDSCRIIQQQIDKARGRQLKIAVAASKKTGKSVIVNGMIGEELAPTSLELATPNSCIYQKSDNGKYYLNYNGEKKYYKLAEELHREIGEEFKRAQEEVDNKFTLPDMEIGYVSEKNNFEAYTIYDTPGPDAAGTGHGEKAKNAMEQCDVVIFAIDYTKYLTTTEEEYLSQIKEQFNSKQKFDSMIFTINKIDERYNDADGSKSIIKSIDFIRNRLRKIDDSYCDCAIFATSALQYFYALEAERECGDELSKSENLFCDIRPLIGKYKKVKGQLNFLDKRAGDLVSYSGLGTVTLEDLKQYSGMPDLLEYTSYIARTKARAELVNSVAYEIDSQQSKIQTVVDRIRNIRELVGANNERIDEITEIFDGFKKQVREILGREIKEEDIVEYEYECGCEYDEIGSSTRQYWEIIKKKKKEFTFENIKAEETDKIQESFAVYFDQFNSGSLANIFFHQIEDEYWKFFRELRKNKTIVSDKWMTKDKVAGIAKRIRNQILTRAQDKTNDKYLEKLNNECEKILENRSRKLRDCMESCEGQLKKMDFEFIMPVLPQFSAVVTKSKVEDINFEQMNDADMHEIEKRLDNLYKKPNVFKRLAENIKNNKWGEQKYQAADFSKEEFANIFRGAWNDICGIAVDIKLEQCIKNDRDQMKQNIEQRVDELNQYFGDALRILEENIGIFTNSIDDREFYKEHNEKLEEEEAVINQIKEATGGFMETWDRICNDKSAVDKKTA